jgi:hypothetical protein
MSNTYYSATIGSSSAMEADPNGVQAVLASVSLTMYRAILAYRDCLLATAPVRDTGEDHRLIIDLELPDQGCQVTLVVELPGDLLRAYYGLR